MTALYITLTGFHFKASLEVTRCALRSVHVNYSLIFYTTCKFLNLHISLLLYTMIAGNP